MSEKFDDELSKHINHVFDQYEDTAPAQEGWLLLRQKFPPQKKRRVIPLWWSVAAALLIAALFGLWFYNIPKESKSTIAKTKTKKQPADTLIKSNQHHTTEQLHPATKKQSAGDPIYAAVGSRKANKGSSLNVPEQNSAYTLTLTTTNSAKATKNAENQLSIASTRAQNAGAPHIVSGDTQQEALSGAPERTAMASAVTNNSTAWKADSAQYASVSQMAQQRPQQSLEKNANLHSDSATIHKSSGLERLLAAEQRMEQAKKTKKTTAAIDKKILFNIYAATYFNYAEGSKSQFNTGAGVSTDIRLSGNFKLSTGVAINKNTLDYNGQPTQSGIARDALSAAPSVSDVQATSYSNTTLGIVPLRVATTPVVSAYNVSLTGLDIPLNIKYELNPRKNDSYISAGLSSGTFITESYTYRYDNTPNAFGLSSNLADATTRRSFNRFDFARTLNLSVGMGYQISKQNRLIIEPFLKYPLSGLGSEQIKFGAGGLNLRFKFQ
ncbi:outer membrane beta-barrel protein [Mucilaginibacter sp. CSA2-8R]|uniref:outer membrane beta-barrel protein n=1 Tax=Mucilaginibacter sp. CSA2-8R TaxID=3141542 RepID=UPI00315CD373